MTANKLCIDVDECELNIDDCADNEATVCINTDSSFECECSDGFNGIMEGNSCIDVDECTQTGDSVCSENGQTACVNIPGSYNCECHNANHGYMVGNTCIDLVTCPADCDDQLNFKCTEGYYSQSKCSCKNGFILNEENGLCEETKKEIIPNQSASVVSCNNPISDVAEMKIAFDINSNINTNGFILEGNHYIKTVAITSDNTRISSDGKGLNMEPRSAD